MYLYKSVAKTISYDDTHWYLNGVPKRIEGDDSPERIKQFAIDEAYKAAAEEISLYSVHFKNRNELWETNKSEIDFIKDKLCVEEGFLKEKYKKIIEEKNIEEFLSLVILYEKLNGEIKDSDGIFVRNKLEQNIANACTLTLDESNSHHQDFIRKLTSRKPSDPRVQLFTTNYDTLFEQAAQREFNIKLYN